MYKIICLFLLVIVVSYYFTLKKEIRLDINNQNVSAVFSNILSSSMKIIVNNKSHIEILQNSFNYPLFLFPIKKTNSIFVLYWFDIEVHMFAIDLNTDIDTSKLNKSLSKIIIATDESKVRSLKDKEIADMIKTIDTLSEKEYKKFSVPSLDLGLYKQYIGKEKVIELLKGGLYQSTDADSIVIQSKVNNPWGNN